ncbi:hypothetical protein BEWA_043950 [Theileria equi strain WA]|uniref:Dolichyl-diphosphooligosaccharide--protein glycosyltransferase 48 kDa subunit n=1 Tax=Theileria equi strain WA TaxID=1537102 RepID=L1LGF6_THEEQ|nr:hypothetical protein BEWA_043950 [Theileria equi strain WA]EKX74354.1 hypothetical protein BEWA_043950 [Theileria equi strain WA]|eukprot:XP_004833806.1 hypothetical protein BEWA_043950 [Theileria equi strain WA]
MSLFIAGQKNSATTRPKLFDQLGIDILPSETKDFNTESKSIFNCSKNPNDIYPLIEGEPYGNVHYRGTAISTKRQVKKLVKGTITTTLEGSANSGKNLEFVTILDSGSDDLRIVVSGSVDMFSNESLSCNSNNVRLVNIMSKYLLHHGLEYETVKIESVEEKVPRKNNEKIYCTNELLNISLKVQKSHRDHILQLEVEYFDIILRKNMDFLQDTYTTTFQLPAHHGIFNLYLHEINSGYFKKEIYRTRIASNAPLNIHSKVGISLGHLAVRHACIIGFVVFSVWIIYPI